MKRNYAGQFVHFPLNTTTGVTTIKIIKDDAAEVDGTGGTSGHENEAIHIGSGVWRYTPTQDETDASEVTFTAINDGGIAKSVTYNPVPYITADAVTTTGVAEALPAISIAAFGTNLITPSGTGVNPAYVAKP